MIRIARSAVSGVGERPWLDWPLAARAGWQSADRSYGRCRAVGVIVGGLAAQGMLGQVRAVAVLRY